MKRRVLSLALTAMMLSAAMVGCGSGGNDSNSGTNNSTEGKTLELYYQKTNVDQFQKIVDKYNEENTKNITVELNAVASDTSKQVFQTRMATKEYMDILQHWTSQAEFRLQIEAGLISDLSNENWVDNVVESYKEISSVDGKLYSLPLAANTMGVAYNKTMFSENNWDIPTTWAEFISLCETMQSAGFTPLVFSNGDKDTVSQKWYMISGLVGDAESFYLGIKDGNGEKVTDNDIAKITSEKLIEVNKFAQKDSMGCSYSQSCADFANGVAPMMITGIWTQSAIEDANPDIDYAYFPLPGDDGNINLVTAVDICLAAIEPSENNEEARDFIAYCAQPEIAQMYHDMDGQPSPILGVEVSNDKIDLLQPHIAEGKTFIFYGDYFPAGERNNIDNACQTLLVDEDIEAFQTEWQRIITAEQ